MTIDIDYILRDEHKNMVQYKTIRLEDADIIKMMQQQFEDDQLPIRMGIQKEKVTAHFSISGGSF